MSENELFAGAGTGKIVFPQELFPIEGFCSVHDDPSARVLVMEKTKRVALVSLELVMTSAEHMEMVRSIVAEHCGVPKENVWIHVTHAITTPHPPRMPFGSGEEPSEEQKKKMELYTDSIKNAVTEAAKSAAENFRPAMLRVAECESLVNCNRDIETQFGWWINLNPEGKSNHTATVLRFDDEQGSSIGMLISFGLKPCAIDNSQMDENKRLVSSDVPGLACRIIEEELGAPCLFFMSAAGDQVPKEQTLLEEVQSDGSVKKIDFGVEKGLEIVNRLGHEMANDILPSIRSAERIEAGEIACGETSIRYPGKARMQMKPRKTVEWQPEGEQTVTAEVIALGEVAFVAVKPEVNTVTEEQLHEVSPYKHTLLMSMTNGGMKYMPDALSYERISWEAQNSPLMPGAAEAWVKETGRLLNSLKNK